MNNLTLFESITVFSDPFQQQ